ncbi:hypothetical protein H5T87_08805 [bacterium]|nr:hypothetical protein [bacterium]
MFYGDIDNDGEKEIVLGVARYNNSQIWWGATINEDIKNFAEIPYNADISLKFFKLKTGKLELKKEVIIWKDADIPWSQTFKMRDFKFGDFNRDGLIEVFFQYEEQATHAKIIQIKGKKVKTLYGGLIGRAIAELKDVDKDGKLEVLEYWDTLHIASEEERETILKGHLCAIQIFKWNSVKREYVPWKLVPDIETEKRLTREELYHSPGAEEILKGVPESELKKIYPRAFR